MSEQELNRLVDSLAEEIRVPVEVLVIEDPWLDEYHRRAGRPELPAWSPATEALVAEYAARTGGAR